MLPFDEIEVSGHDGDSFLSCVGNPPYQKDAEVSTSDTWRVPADIFPSFQRVSNSMAELTCLIYPTTWQRDLDKGLGEFLIENGLHSSITITAPHAFPTVDRDLVFSVVFTRSGYSGGVNVDGKMMPNDKGVWLNTEEKLKVFRQAEQYPHKFKVFGWLTKISNATDYPEGTVIPTGVKSFKNRPPKKRGYLSIYLKKTKGKRPDAEWHYISKKDIPERYLKRIEAAKHFRVCVRSAPIPRYAIFTKIVEDNTFLDVEIFGEHEISGATFYCLQDFDTLEEAENFGKYVQTRFFTLLAYFDISRKTLARFAPDLGDYTNKNPLFVSDDVLGKGHPYYELGLNERLMSAHFKESTIAQSIPQ